MPRYLTLSRGLLFSGFQPERTGWTPQPRHWPAGCPRTRSRPNNTDGTRPGRGEMVPPKKRIINWPLHQSPPHRITEETRLDVTSGAHPGNPLLKQDHVQMPSEHLQGWRATTLPGKLLPSQGKSISKRSGGTLTATISWLGTGIP